MKEPVEPYRSPSELSAVPLADLSGVTFRLEAAVLRLSAGLLAAGGTAWALLCAAVILSGGANWHSIAVFGPGFIVTYGYYWRALAPPPMMFCRVIWGSSLLVQGSWLAFIAAEAWGELGNGPAPPGVYMVVFWWSSSTLLSLVGLCLDPGVGERGAGCPE